MRLLYTNCCSTSKPAWAGTASSSGSCSACCCNEYYHKAGQKEHTPSTRCYEHTKLYTHRHGAARRDVRSHQLTHPQPSPSHPQPSPPNAAHNRYQPAMQPLHLRLRPLHIKANR
jgi:hypothetical protein